MSIEATECLECGVGCIKTVNNPQADERNGYCSKCAKEIKVNKRKGMLNLRVESR